MNKISDIYPLMCKFESNKQIYYSKSEYLTYSLESSAPYVNFPGDQKLSQLKNNPQALSPSLFLFLCYFKYSNDLCTAFPRNPLFIIRCKRDSWKLPRASFDSERGISKQTFPVEGLQFS